MQEHGSIRMLLRIDGLDDVEPAAVWQDLEMAPDYLRDIDRFAVVGDQRWHGWVTTLGSAVAEAEHFPTEQLERAWA